jgi:hypothetical protein
VASVLGERSNLLITYIENYSYFDEGKRVEHPDPTFEREWSYCTGNRALLKCGKNNYVFFHATKRDPITNTRVRFITAYFVIKAVGLGREIVPRYNIMGPASHAEEIENHYVIVGDEKLSKKLREPGLRFDRNLAERLVFDPPKRIRFGITNRLGRRLSELECIAYSTRSIRVLTDEDVNTLLLEIDRASYSAR